MHDVTLVRSTVRVVRPVSQGVQLVRFAVWDLYVPMGQGEGAMLGMGVNQPGMAMHALMLVLMKGEVRPRTQAKQGRELRPRVTCETPYALTPQFTAVQMLVRRMSPWPGWITARAAAEATEGE